MKYIWLALFLLMMAVIGMAYVFTDILDYFFPRRSQTEIVVQSPDIPKEF